MAEYSRIAQGSFTSTGAAKSIYLPFQPNLIRMTNYTAAATPANHGIPYATWQSGMGQGFGIVSLFNSTPALITDSVDANGFSTFNANSVLSFGAPIQISGITKAAAAVVTTGSAHGYASGDVVIFYGLYQSSTTGMPQICGIPFVITVTGSTTFTIPWNTNQSNYTALSGSPTGAFVKKVLYPDLYLPSGSVISAVSTGTTTTVTCTTNHNFVAGQEVGFHIPSQYGITELNELPNSVIPGSPVYGVVTSVTSNTVFVCNIDSSTYTAYANNVAVASVGGLSFPQVYAIGSLNSGGPSYSGGNLYPSQSFPTSSGGVATIGGPGLLGAFTNNTRQGFVIGAGTAAGDSSAVLVGATSDVVYWEAVLTDF